ncbi:unnamed protein product [Ixodes persulcatus]
MAATRDKSTNPGEVEEKLKRAQRQIARLEKELWEKDRELEKLRYLNMKLQESIIEKFESWKGMVQAAAAPPSVAAMALPDAAPSSAAVPAAMALPVVSALAPAASVAVAVSVAPAPAPAAVALPEVPAPAPLHAALPGVGEPPAGMRHHIVENGMVDLGQGIYVTTTAWSTVCK